MILKNFISTLPIFFLFCLSSQSQSTAYKNIVDLYTKSLENQKMLYTGFEHNRIPGAMRGYPYFDFSYKTGTINYFNEEFIDVPLLYDIYMDEVILEHRDVKGYLHEIQLFKEEINKFSIENHQFIKISSDTMTGGEFASGFYEVLYDGNVKVYLKSIKIRSEEIDEIERKAYVVFSLKKNFIMYHKGTYHAIKRKKAAYKVLNDHKKELVQFYRGSGLKFRKNPEQVLTGIAQVYDKMAGTNE